MAAIGNLVLTDGLAASRTFNPARVESGFASWENRAGDVYIGYDKISWRLVRPTGPVTGEGNRNLKLHLKLETPLLKTVSTTGSSSGYTSGPDVDYRLVCEMKFTLPESCTTQDRDHIWALALGLISNTTTQAALVDYDMPY